MRKLHGAVVRGGLIAAFCLCGMGAPLIGPAVAQARVGCCADLEARGRLGGVWLGQHAPASDDIAIINRGAQISDAALHDTNPFGLRLHLACGRTSDLNLAPFADSVDRLRGEFIGGFALSAVAGEDDI